jgi:hypothetical protein
MKDYLMAKSISRSSGGFPDYHPKVNEIAVTFLVSDFGTNVNPIAYQRYIEIQIIQPNVA